MTAIIDAANIILFKCSFLFISGQIYEIMPINPNFAAAMKPAQESAAGFQEELKIP